MTCWQSISPKLHRSMIFILWYLLVQKVKNCSSPLVFLSHKTFFKYSPFSLKWFQGKILWCSTAIILRRVTLKIYTLTVFIEKEIREMIIIYDVQGQYKPLETFLDEIKFFSGVGVSLDKSIVIKSDSMLASSRPKSQIKLDPLVQLPRKLNPHVELQLTRIRVT